MNVDATWSENTRSGGTSWIIRDWNGRPTRGGCIPISTGWSIKVLKAKTIVDGLKHILAYWDEQNLPVEVKSNSIEVIKFLNREMSELSEAYFFFVERLSLLLLL